MSLMPNTVSARDIQRNYRKIFDRVKRSKKPTVVLTNNKPEVAIVDVKQLEAMQQQIEAAELKDALQAVKEYETAVEKGTLIEADSLADLIDE